MDVERQARGAENHLLGKWGEALVAEDLRKKGWQVLAAGYRCRLGEIDLIARKGRFIVFLEVKLRKSEGRGGGGSPKAEPPARHGAALSGAAPYRPSAPL